MSTIHGRSVDALKYFRAKPAALAVYWVYISRTNYEGVAWPSLRGLNKTTGWSVDVCAEARAWLVEHGALERVAAYVRPAWRNFEPAQKAKMLNLDRAEYYRPTGVITVDGHTYDLLYFGQNGGASVAESGSFDLSGLPDDDTADDGRRPTSDAVEHRPDRTELDSSSELSTKKQDDEDDNARAREGVQASTPEPDAPNIFALYHTTFGKLVSNPILADDLKDMQAEYAWPDIVAAFNAAALANATNHNYARRCLEDWRVNGRDKPRVDKPATPKNTGPLPRPPKPNSRVSALPPLAKDAPPPPWLNTGGVS